MQEFFARLASYLPPAVADYAPWLIIATVIGVTLALALVVRGLNDARRAAFRRKDDDGPSLVETLEANRAPTDWAGRMDANFTGMVKRTGLGMGADQAVAVILLSGAIVASVLMFWQGDFWLVAGGLVLGAVLPLGLFLAMQGRWRAQLQSQLPDSFFLIARSLRAGLSLDQSLALMGKQGVQPLAAEYHTAAEQTKLGLNVTAALDRMAERIRLTDFNVFAAVVQLHRQAGGNLAVLLDRVAATTRDRNLFRGQFKAATALGRITAFFICLAMPGFLIIYATMQPEFLLRFLSDPRGQIAFGVACALQVIGVVWIALLQRTDY